MPEKLIDDWKYAIKKLAYSFDPAHADDLINLGYMVVIDNIEDYDEDRAQLSTFIFNKVKWAMSDWVKQYDRNNKYKDTEVSIDDVVNILREDNPEDLIINRETTGELLKGLDSLTKREQDILRLIYWNGMSYLEVASVLNISESRVGQVHNKSLKKLKKVLTNE